MRSIPYLELRDLDGSYIVALPLDEQRCRVLWSNVALRGAVLAKANPCSWSYASEDLGGHTRIVPSDLDSAEGTDPDPEIERLNQIVDPATRETREGEEPELGDEGRRRPGRSVRPSVYAGLAREMAILLRKWKASSAGSRRGYDPELALDLWKNSLSQNGGRRRAARLLSRFAAQDGSAPVRIPHLVRRALLHRWKRLARRPLKR